MGPFEGEPCLGVVKCLDARPSILVVAALARLAEPTFVRIDCLVTIHAPPGRAAEFSRGLVTLAAGDRGVNTVEREICEDVIKCLAIELNNVGAATFVIGVTISAFLFRGVPLAPVIAPTRQAIRSDLFMTSKAQVALRLP